MSLYDIRDAPVSVCIYSQKRPMCPQKRPMQLQKRPIHPQSMALIDARDAPVSFCTYSKETYVCTKRGLFIRKRDKSIRNSWRCMTRVMLLCLRKFVQKRPMHPQKRPIHPQIMALNDARDAPVSVCMYSKET